jgi:hypothetical protein
MIPSIGQQDAADIPENCADLCHWCASGCPRRFGERKIDRLRTGPVKAFVGLRPSFSAQVRFGEPGAPVAYLESSANLKNFLYLQNPEYFRVL